MLTLTKTAYSVGLLTAGLLLAGSTLKGSTTVTQRNITRSTITKTVTMTPPASKNYTVENISLDPKQVIFLNTEVTGLTVEMIIAQINTLSKNGKDIYLLLSSPGGSVFDGARLISYMEGATVNVNTVCYDMCASMAAQIHQHGTKRYVLPSATLMFHQAAGSVEGSLKEMKSRLGYVDLEVAKLDAYIANRSGIDREAFDRLVEHEYWVDGQDAVDKKLSDGLVTISFNNNGGGSFVVSEQLEIHHLVDKQLIPNKNPLKDIY